MHISLTDAKARLTDLVRRAEAGDEVVLTRHGQPTARIIAVRSTLSSDDRRARRRAALEAFRGSAKNCPGPDAAHSADFLYDEAGLPT